jgi:hypothetical protein
MKAIFRDALHHRYRYSSRCRATSATVTLLTTYLWQSQPVRAHYKSSKVYGVIGKIIQEMSTPTCFVCDEPHTFNDWRAVRVRDQLGRGGGQNAASGCGDSSPGEASLRASQMRLFRREDVEKFRQAREIEKRSPHPHSA